MSATIYKFERPAAQPKPAHKPTAIERPLTEPATETGRNFRLRQARDEAWSRADQTTRYWRARMDWHYELKCAQESGLADSGSFPPAEDRESLVETWREAVAKKLLTPAPNVAAVAWKRAKLSGRDFRFLPVKPERIERAIAEDVEFLRAHPTRRSGKRGMDPQKLEERRTFKAAFRARVTAFAEQNGIDKSELAWLGRLKHEELAAFAERHRLSYDWLLEGKGQTFRSA